MKLDPAILSLAARQVSRYHTFALVLTLALIIRTLSISPSSHVRTVSNIIAIVARIGQGGRPSYRGLERSSSGLSQRHAGATTIADDVANLHARYGSPPRCQDPNNYVYYGNRLGRVHRFTGPRCRKANCRISSTPRNTARCTAFWGINGELKFIRRKAFRSAQTSLVQGQRSTKQHAPGRPSIDFRTARLVATRAGGRRGQPAVRSQWSLPTCHCNGWQLRWAARHLGQRGIIEPR